MTLCSRPRGGDVIMTIRLRTAWQMPLPSTAYALLMIRRIAIEPRA